MGSADARQDRNTFATPIERLQWDMRDNGYFARGVLAGKKAHTNEHIQADCIAAILEIHAKLNVLLARTPGAVEDQGLRAEVTGLAARLEKLDGKVKAFVIANA